MYFCYFNVFHMICHKLFPIYPDKQQICEKVFRQAKQFHKSNKLELLQLQEITKF